MKPASKLAVNPMPRYVEVVVNVPRVSGTFDYHLPPELEGQIEVGHLALAPFGQQTVQGVVTGFVEQPGVHKTRSITGLVDADIRLTGQQIELF